jgi:short-subunit dehydrogenase
VKRYDGYLAVVAGASSGIGRQIALDLRDRGAQVVGIARRPCEGMEHRQCDVSDTESYTALLEGLGPIDVLVQAAAFERRTRIEDRDLDLYAETFATNVLPVIAGTLAVVPGMLERGRGYVLNISSDHGRAPAPGTPAYSASKAAVSAFSESIAHEVRGRGVHVHVLYPGWVPTSLGQGAVDQGMPEPPRFVRRSAEQVSRLALDRLGGGAIDINASRVAAAGPTILRALMPRLYRRAMAAQS